MNTAQRWVWYLFTQNCWQYICTVVCWILQGSDSCGVVFNGFATAVTGLKNTRTTAHRERERMDTLQLFGDDLWQAERWKITGIICKPFSGPLWTLWNLLSPPVYLNSKQAGNTQEIPTLARHKSIFGFLMGKHEKQIHPHCITCSNTG